MCPECGSENVRIEEYDFGVCRETGYHDAGEMYCCAACGAGVTPRMLARCVPFRYYRAENSGALRDLTI
jgi:hypothetical protein